MRMRRIKWAVDYLDQALCLVRKPEKYKGKWKQQLGCEKLHVEIGCGKGNYSLNMSKLYPQEGFIAVEKNESAAGITAKKYDEDNEKGKLSFIHGDAENIDEWFAEKEVDVIHLNFSDPWPKKHYHKRRLSSEKFLNIYKTLLNENGKILMKTDNKDLFEDSVLYFLQNGFTLTDFSVDFRREEHSEDAITEYESKFMEQGLSIYRLCAVVDHKE